MTKVSFPHDQFAKALLQFLLSPFGECELSREVHSQVRFVDMAFTPKAEGLKQDVGRRPGLLGQIAWRPMLFEVFRAWPGEGQLREALTKQDLVRHELRLKRKRASAGQAQDPGLCQVIPTMPEEAKRRLGLTARSDLGEGVWGFPAALDALVVVVHELVATPETMWLRLLGRGEVQRQALEQLQSQAGADAFYDSGLELMLTWRTLLEGAGEMTPQDREFYQNTEKVFQQFCQRLQGEGEAKGLRLALRDLCEVFGIALTPEREHVVAQLDAHGLERLRQDIKRTHAWPA